MNLLETLPTVIGAAAIAPALLLLWLVIAADERPGPPGMVWAAFLLGAACILLLGAFYSACTWFGPSAYGAISAFGLVVAGVMVLIQLWYWRTLRRYPREVIQLLRIARTDKHH